MKYSKDPDTLTRLVAEEVFVHKKFDLDWTEQHYLSTKLVLISLDFIAGNAYILNN